MPASPLDTADGVLTLQVTSQGRPLADDIQLLSVETRHELNQLPSARLVFADGNMAEGRFPLSDQPTLAPDAVIQVSAGYGGAANVIFEGVVVRHRVCIAGDNRVQLIVDCCDPAFRMGTERRCATHPGQSDSALLTALITRAGLTADVWHDAAEPTDPVQVNCSDWDFLVARAEARGWAVLAQAGTVQVAPPDTTAAAVLQVTWGQDLLSCDLEVDSGPRWADQRHLPRVRGQMQFQGSASARVGQMIELRSVGQRFNGPVWVRSVVHVLQQGQWVTDVGFGPPPVAAPAPSAGPAPFGIQGLHLGRIVGHGNDPAGAHRLQVLVPGLGPEAAPLWARLLQFQAGDGAGAWFVPAVGDEVVLGFFNSDPHQPVILGSLYSAQHRPPGLLADSVETQGFVTRGGQRLAFDDAAQSITVSTAAGQQVQLSDSDRSIVLQDTNGNRVTLDPQGVAIHTPSDLQVQALGSITLAATGGVHIAAQGAVQLSGLDVACTAQIGFKANGQATAELSAGGQTTVRGGLVLIN